MALSFTNTKGKAQKGSTVAQYKYKDGENTLRLFGEVLPRYIYWVKSAQGKDVPFECLSFDRDAERFTNTEVDHVQEKYPDLKCSWNYSMNCIDLSDGKPKVINFKKKLFEQILTASEDLGDPTDPDKGFDIVFKRIRTGPSPFNVEYQLQVLRCKNRPLTDSERAIVAQEPSIDSKYPRPTPDDIKAGLERISQEVEPATEAEAEAVHDLVM